MTSRVFDRVCEELERLTEMNSLESRGTVRFALREAGLDPSRVTPRQMTVVLGDVLRRELRARAVKDAHAVCRALQTLVAGEDDATADAGDRIDAFFRRTL